MVKEKVDEAIETLVDNEPRDVSYNESYFNVYAS